MHIQRYRPHVSLLTVDTPAGEPVGKRHRRIRARSATGQVAGAATEKPGLKPIVQTGLPSLRSPRRPLVPVDRTYVDHRTKLSLRSAVSCPEIREPGPTPSLLAQTRSRRRRRLQLRDRRCCREDRRCPRHREDALLVAGAVWHPRRGPRAVPGRVQRSVRVARGALKGSPARARAPRGSWRPLSQADPARGRCVPSVSHEATGRARVDRENEEAAICGGFARALCRTRTGDPFLTMAVPPSRRLHPRPTKPLRSDASRRHGRP